MSLLGGLFAAHKDVKHFNPEAEERWEVVAELNSMGLPAVSAYVVLSSNELKSDSVRLRIVNTGRTRKVLGEEKEIVNVEALIPAQTTWIVTVVS